MFACILRSGIFRCQSRATRPLTRVRHCSYVGSLGKKKDPILVSDNQTNNLNGKQPSLNLIQSPDGYLGHLFVPKEKSLSRRQNNINTTVILDASESMGDNITRIYSTILPSVFEKLKYDPNQLIKTIGFGWMTKCYIDNYRTMRTRDFFCLGTTNMAPAIERLGVFIRDMHSPHRILTISDGILDDQEATVTVASMLANSLRGQYSINSQAVRFFTSEAPPDTRGLASVLQLNTVNQPKLLDIYSGSPDRAIVDQIASLFNDDFTNYVQIQSNNKIMLQTPWTTPLDRYHVKQGDNLLWFKEIPKDLTITGQNIQIPINTNEYIWPTLHELIKKKCEDLVKQLKVLKVIGTADANKEVQNIMICISKLQWFLKQNCIGSGDDGEPLLLLASKIANDNTISSKSSNEQAEFLKN